MYEHYSFFAIYRKIKCYKLSINWLENVRCQNNFLSFDIKSFPIALSAHYCIDHLQSCAENWEHTFAYSKTNIYPTVMRYIFYCKQRRIIIPAKSVAFSVRRKINVSANSEPVNKEMQSTRKDRVRVDERWTIHNASWWAHLLNTSLAQFYKLVQTCSKRNV